MILICYQHLTNISSATHILNFGCLLSGHYIYESKNVRARSYFLNPKGVCKQNCFGNTVLDELENQEVSVPKISRRHENVYAADDTYCTNSYNGRRKCTTPCLVEKHTNTTGYSIIGGHFFLRAPTVQSRGRQAATCDPRRHFVRLSRTRAFRFKMGSLN
jgi:hypothetical protein